MKLSTYIVLHGLSYRAFAARIGASDSIVMPHDWFNSLYASARLAGRQLEQDTP